MTAVMGNVKCGAVFNDRGIRETVKNGEKIRDGRSTGEKSLDRTGNAARATIGYGSERLGIFRVQVKTSRFEVHLLEKGWTYPGKC